MQQSKMRYGLYALVALGFLFSQFRGCSSSNQPVASKGANSSQAAPTKAVTLQVRGLVPNATQAVVVVHCPDIPLDRSQLVTIKDGKLDSSIQIDASGCKNIFVEIQAEGMQTFKKGPISVTQEVPAVELGSVQLAAAPAARTSKVSAAEQNPKAIVGNKAAAEAYLKGEVLPPTVVGGKPASQPGVPGAALP